MGRGIVYCATCGNKILDKDFDSRAAFHLDGRGFCKDCAPAALKALPPDKMAEVLARISESESPSKRKVPVPRPAAPAPATRRQAPAPSRTPLIAGLAVTGVVIVILLGVMLSRSDPPPPPPSVGERPPKVDREALAAQALQKAREYRDAHPKELATQLASFQRLIEDYRGTRAAGDAQRDVEEIRRRGAEALDAELKVLQEQARSASAAEEFQKAIQTLTDARGKHPEATWTQGIDRTISEICGLAEKLFPAVKAAAVDARRQGAAAGVQEAKERVAKWGFPEYVSSLETALAAVPVSEKRPLFNGKDLSGWYVTRGKWGYKDGLPQAIELDDGQRTFIATNEEFGDFELEGMVEILQRTYTEFNARGQDWTVPMHLDPGWHKFRVVATGMDVKLFVDEKPIGLSKGTSTKGQFGIFTLGAIRLKDVTVKP